MDAIPRVLVIEDDPAVRLGVVQALDLAGMPARGFGDAESALGGLDAGHARRRDPAPVAGAEPGAGISRAFALTGPRKRRCLQSADHAGRDDHVCAR